MQMIERDVRMAGFEYRDNDAKVTYGSITGPLVIKDSGNQCCDEATIIYDYYDEESKKAEPPSEKQEEAAMEGLSSLFG